MNEYIVSLISRLGAVLQWRTDVNLGMCMAMVCSRRMMMMNQLCEDATIDVEISRTTVALLGVLVVLDDNDMISLSFDAANLQQMGMFYG